MGGPRADQTLRGPTISLSGTTWTPPSPVAGCGCEWKATHLVRPPAPRWLARNTAIGYAPRRRRGKSGSSRTPQAPRRAPWLVSSCDPPGHGAGPSNTRPDIPAAVRCNMRHTRCGPLEPNRRGNTAVHAQTVPSPHVFAVEQVKESSEAATTTGRDRRNGGGAPGRRAPSRCACAPRLRHCRRASTSSSRHIPGTAPVSRTGRQQRRRARVRATHCRSSTGPGAR